MKEFMMDIAFEEIPVSGCTYGKEGVTESSYADAVPGWSKNSIN